MEDSLRQSVWDRARGRCEYCRLPQQLTTLPHQPDHIVAQKHGGPTTSDNLCLSCYPCNAHKGPNIAGMDPETGRLCGLFHARRDAWEQHFRWDGPILVGLTPTGRATIAVLSINLPERVEHRRLLIAGGVFPPL